MKNSKQPPSRRYSDRPFPPYRYIPGETPHPEIDPKGHSYGRRPLPVSYLSPEKWRENAKYLYAVDLYNFHYWWEAHEAWETVWQTTQKIDDYGQFLQGLIQISAGMLKWHTRQEKGRKSLFKAGVERLRTLPGTTFMGLDLPKHLKKIEQFLATLDKSDYPFVELLI